MPGRCDPAGRPGAERRNPSAPASARRMQAAIGAIAGAAVPLGLALAHLWQAGVLALAAVWLIGLRRGVVTAIGGSAALGVIVFLAGGPMT